MSVFAIRAAMHDALLAPLVGVDPGFSATSPYPPESITVLPFGFIGPIQTNVTPATYEVWERLVPLTMVFGPLPQLGMQLAYAEQLLDAVYALWRTNYTLAGTTMGMQLGQEVEGVVDLAGSSYVAVTLHFAVKEKINAGKTG